MAYGTSKLATMKVDWGAVNDQVTVEWRRRSNFGVVVMMMINIGCDVTCCRMDGGPDINTIVCWIGVTGFLSQCSNLGWIVIRVRTINWNGGA